MIDDGAGSPVPPSTESAPAIVLSCRPVALVAVTLTCATHVALPAKSPPVRLTSLPAGLAVSVPPHVLDAPLGVDTSKPAGNASSNARPVSVEARGLGRGN